MSNDSVLRIHYRNPKDGPRHSEYFAFDDWGEAQKKIGELQLAGVVVVAKKLSLQDLQNRGYGESLIDP